MASFFNMASFVTVSAAFLDSQGQYESLAAVVAEELAGITSYDGLVAAKTEFIALGFERDNGEEFAEFFREHGTAGLELGSKDPAFRSYENQFGYCAKLAEKAGWEKPGRVLKSGAVKKASEKPSKATTNKPSKVDAEAATLSEQFSADTELATAFKIASVNPAARAAILDALQAYLHPLAEKPHKRKSVADIVADIEMDE